MLTTYAEAEAFLNSLINYEKLLGAPITYDTKSFDLDNFRQVLRKLGDPHLRYSAIHVAGTKGKGSTCVFLSNVLRAAGHHVGLYTSPHISSYTERIAVDGVPVSVPDFCRLLSLLAPHVAPQDATEAGFRTVFELLTAAAFLYFAQQQVDIAVIETGLGGRLDSTNVFDQPPEGGGVLVNVITAMGLEHTSILGETIQQIATEKAGILRPHAPTVLAPQQPEARCTVASVVGDRSLALGQPTLVDADSFIHGELVSEDADPSRMLARFRTNTTSISAQTGSAAPGTSTPSSVANLLRDGCELESHLLGHHQIDNIRTALATLIVLQNSSSAFSSIGQDALQYGISHTTWAGRFEIVSADPLLIVDGAHCVLSAHALAETFVELFDRREVIAVIGFMRDKAAAEICRTIAARMNVVAAACCSPASPRALSADATATIANDTFAVPCAAVPDPAHAAAFALSQAQDGQAVVAFGSMFLVAPVKQAWLGAVR